MSSPHRVVTTAVMAVLLAASVIAVEPVEQVLGRATAAFEVLDGHGVSGEYLMTAKVKTKAPGDDGPEDILEVHRVEIGPDGVTRTTLVKAVEDGRDVTEQRRRRGEAEDEEKPDERSEVDIELLPIGKNVRLYTFKAPKIKDGVAVASYRPRVDVDDDELSHGRVAWDVESGDPLWIEAEPVDEPPFVGEIALRFEFSRSGGVLHASRITTHVRAGIPLILRVKVDVEIEMSEVRLEPKEAVVGTVVSAS